MDTLARNEVGDLPVEPRRDDLPRVCPAVCPARSASLALSPQPSPESQPGQGKRTKVSACRQPDYPSFQEHRNSLQYKVDINYIPPLQSTIPTSIITTSRPSSLSSTQSRADCPPHNTSTIPPHPSRPPISRRSTLQIRRILRDKRSYSAPTQCPSDRDRHRPGAGEASPHPFHHLTNTYYTDHRMTSKPRNISRRPEEKPGTSVCALSQCHGRRKRELESPRGGVAPDAGRARLEK